MNSRKLSRAAALFTILGLSFSAYAQQTRPPTLNQILQQIESNLDRYDTQLPSLFCDEHVVSSQLEIGQHNRNTVTDSVFSLKRTPTADHRTALVESHLIKLVDGEPPTLDDLNRPTSLSGAFEGGLAVVSLNQIACMRYELQRPNKHSPNDPVIVHFVTALTSENSADCLLQEYSKGRILIDPVSMQIKRLEISTPHHTMIEDGENASHGVGKRDLTIDHAPTVLGSQTFWMPSTITMHVTSGTGTFHLAVWSFTATYRNFHKLEVTSRILPGGSANEP